MQLDDDDDPTVFKGVTWKRSNVRENSPATSHESGYDQTDTSIFPTPNGKIIEFDNRDENIFSTVAKVGSKVDRKSVDARAAEKKEMGGLMDGKVLRLLTSREVQSYRTGEPLAV